MSKIKMSSVLLFLVCMLVNVQAQRTVALAGVNNRSGNRNYDYLSGIIEGTVLFNLSQIEGLILVERQNLDSVLQEQKLSLYGLTADMAGTVAGLLQADSLLLIDYVITDGLQINVRIIDTSNSEVKAISVRGVTENILHELSGLIAAEFGFSDRQFDKADHRRSLFTMKNLIPGSLRLFCNLHNAGIYLDDTFIGYTAGDLYSALEFPDIEPGEYRLRIVLNRDFGVIDHEPMRFRDWEKDVEIRSGRSLVVRADIRDFNSQIYDLQNLLNEEIIISIDDPEYRIDRELVYTDRYGMSHSIQFSILARLNNETVRAEGVLVVNNKAYSLLALSGANYREMIGPLAVRIDLSEVNTGQYKILSRIERRDIYQGMHRNYR